VIGNIVRRVMHIIREEMQEEAEDVFLAAAGGGGGDAAEQEPLPGGLSRALKSSSSARAGWARTFSLHNLLDQGLGDEQPPSGAAAASAAGPSGPAAPPRPRPPPQQQQAPPRVKPAPPPWDRKQEVIDGVNDLVEELKDIDAAIAAHAPEHIHANEVVLTFGASRTVETFLARAHEKARFQVVVAEGAPTLQGHGLAARLAAAGIRTTAIADAAVYALMARVNKVVVSAHALLADGGAMAPVGTALVAAAARRHAVPFVVLVGMYKLSPHFPHEPGVTFNDFRETSDVLPYRDEAVLTAEAAGAHPLPLPLPLRGWWPPGGCRARGARASERCRGSRSDHPHGVLHADCFRPRALARPFCPRRGRGAGGDAGGR
jgi:translation initiation factor eIF-2B subunit beta